MIKDPEALRDERVSLETKLDLLIKQKRLIESKKAKKVRPPDEKPLLIKDYLKEDIQAEACQLIKVAHDQDSTQDSSNVIQEIITMLTGIELMPDGDYYDELALEKAISYPLDLSIEKLVQQENERIKRRLYKMYNELLSIREHLNETQLFFDQEDGVWLRELKDLCAEAAQICSRTDSPVITFRNNDQTAPIPRVVGVKFLKNRINTPDHLDLEISKVTKSLKLAEEQIKQKQINGSL